MSAAPAIDSFTGNPDWSEAITDVQSLSRSLVNNQGQVASTLDYVNFKNTAYSVTTPAFGTKGSNYLETDYYFDPLGRQDSVHNPDGTVDDTVYDTVGDDLEDWEGTKDGGAASFQSFVAQKQDATTGPSGTTMYEVTQNSYDPDGDLVSCQSYTGLNQSGSLITAPDYTGTNVSRTTYYQYDGEDDLTGTLAPNGVATIQTLDNAGEAVNTQTYAAATWDDDEIDLAQAPQRPSLRAIR